MGATTASRTELEQAQYIAVMAAGRFATQADGAEVRVARPVVMPTTY
jgi:hypothetical protein